MKNALKLLTALTFVTSISSAPLWADQIDADNTAKNDRDKDSATLTPFDQSENEADRTLTQRIRQAVVADDELSVNAKNIKIITVDGVVTLRGPVNSEEERQRVLAKAQEAAGLKNINNQLEINEE